MRCFSPNKILFFILHKNTNSVRQKKAQKISRQLLNHFFMFDSLPKYSAQVQLSLRKQSINYGFKKFD
jgi:hypothetical protein